MSTNFEYRERESNEGDRPAKLNEKKTDTELEREMKKKSKPIKEIFLVGRTT